MISYASSSDWFIAFYCDTPDVITSARLINQTPFYTPSNLSCSEFELIFRWASEHSISISGFVTDMLQACLAGSTIFEDLFAESKDCGVHIFGFIFKIIFS